MAVVDFGAARPRRRAPLRLTRRGRLVAALLLGTLYLLLSAAAVAVGATASRAADSTRLLRTVVVQPRDSLWSIAERHLADDDRIAVVEQIRRLNSLDDYTVHPGQRLTVPVASNG
jgi:LysM repeat protein